MTIKNTILSTTVSIIAILGLSATVTTAQQAVTDQKSEIEMDKAAEAAEALAPAAGEMAEDAQAEVSEDVMDDAQDKVAEEAPKASAKPPM